MSLSSELEAAEDVKGEGTYEYGDSVKIEATSEVGYEFVNWTDADDEEVSTDAVYSFDIEEDRELKTNFELMEYTVTFEDHDGIELKK